MTNEWSSFERDQLLMESWRQYIKEEPQKVEEFLGMGQAAREKKWAAAIEAPATGTEEYPSTELLTLLTTLRAVNKELNDPKIVDANIQAELQKLIKMQKFVIKEQGGAMIFGRPLGLQFVTPTNFPTLSALWQAAAANPRHAKAVTSAFTRAGFKGQPQLGQAAGEGDEGDEGDDAAPGTGAITRNDVARLVAATTLEEFGTIYSELREKDPRTNLYTWEQILADARKNPQFIGTNDRNKDPAWMISTFGQAALGSSARTKFVNLVKASKDATPTGTPTYIGRPAWRKFSTQLQGIVGDATKTQQLLQQIVAQFKANNIKIGAAPVTEAAEPKAPLTGDKFIDGLLAIFNAIIRDPAKYHFGRSEEKLKERWDHVIAQVHDQLQGASPSKLKELRVLIRQASAKTKEFSLDKEHSRRQRMKARKLTIPYMTKYGKLIDAVRKNRRKADLRKYGLEDTATDAQIAKAKADEVKQKVKGKHVVTQPGKFMMSGLNIYMQRQLGLDKAARKTALRALQQFIKKHTKLRLGESRVYDTTYTQRRP